MLTLNIRSDLKRLERDLTRLEREQLPFAAAQTLTALARQVAMGEQEAFKTGFDRPTPFTLNAFGVIPARKGSLQATVFIKDIQARYVAPFIDGGPQVLGAKEAILTPRDITTNAYGNLPRARLAALRGRADIFIGQVRGVGGVWQRVNVTRTGKARRSRQRGGAYHPVAGQLKLLIQFTRPAEVTHRVGYYETAARIVKAGLPAAWSSALAKAMATAR